MIKTIKNIILSVIITGVVASTMASVKVDEDRYMSIATTTTTKKTTTKKSTVKKPATKKPVVKKPVAKAPAKVVKPVTPIKPVEQVKVVTPVVKEAPKPIKEYTGKGVKVAVIDSGIDIENTNFTVAGGFNFDSYGGSLADDFGHGTMMASFIASKELGIAPNVDLYVLKVMSSPKGTYEQIIIQAIRWCIDNDMDIINMSFATTSYSYAYKQIIEEANKAGILMIAAAGNDKNATNEFGNVRYPAAFPEVVAVSALNTADLIADFSSTGPQVDVSIRGKDLKAHYLRGAYIHFVEGTSPAAAQVSGIAALLKEAHPDYTTDQLKELLISLTVDAGDPGVDSLYGHGVLSVTDKIKYQYAEDTIKPVEVAKQ